MSRRQWTSGGRIDPRYLDVADGRVCLGGRGRGGRMSGYSDEEIPSDDAEYHPDSEEESVEGAVDVGCCADVTLSIPLGRGGLPPPPLGRDSRPLGRDSRGRRRHPHHSTTDYSSYGNSSTGPDSGYRPLAHSMVDDRYYGDQSAPQMVDDHGDQSGYPGRSRPPIRYRRPPICTRGTSSSSSGTYYNGHHPPMLGGGIHGIHGSGGHSNWSPLFYGECYPRTPHDRDGLRTVGVSPLVGIYSDRFNDP